MKTFIASLFLLLTAPAMAASTITLSIPDITCEVCAQTITANLEKDPAVEKVTVDVEARTADLTLKDNAEISDAAIRKAVDKAGFTVKTIAR